MAAAAVVGGVLLANRSEAQEEGLPVPKHRKWLLSDLVDAFALGKEVDEFLDSIPEEDV